MASARYCHQNGQFHEAIEFYRQVLELEPTNFDAVHLLGRAANQIGQGQIAEDFFRAALSLRPDSIEASVDLGLVLAAQGKLEQSLESFLDSLGLDLATPEANFNIATSFFESGQTDSALHFYRAALVLQPDLLEAHIRMGMVYFQREELHQALQCFSRAHQIDPVATNVLNLLAKVRLDQGRPDDALFYLEQVLVQFPQDELANLLKKVAEMSLQDHSSRKEALFNAGLVDQAETLAREELSCADSVENHNFLLKCYLANDRHSAQDYFNESRAWALAHEHEEALPAPEEFNNDRNPLRRLRVGIVGDYFSSMICRFTLYPFFKLYDHAKLELYCYNFGVGEEEVRPMVDQYRNILGLSGDEFFGLVRQDAIDIMLDINGRIRTPNYFEAMLRQPAPIQVNWYNLPCTVGVKAYNYVITDSYCVRSGEAHSYVEKIFTMPTGTICGWDLGESPIVSPPPCEENGYVTFGCFGDFFKVSERALSVWANLLKQVPDARLYLKSNNLRLTSECERISGFFHQRGIAPERLILEGMSSYGQMKKQYGQVDIALDTFPYSSGSTTINALWQGVPVIAIEGNDWRGRSTAAVLAGAGLERFIAKDIDGYLDIAAGLAADTAQLIDLRANLGKHMAASPQWQVEKQTRDFESVLRRIWLDWLSQ